mmetsp:Transcript_12569/g.14182  ORF Transcript_12569/g.14182 Transcript_12569/m.14182 type:complete len:665 (-) Transcript_12569:36-2030(-)
MLMLLLLEQIIHLIIIQHHQQQHQQHHQQYRNGLSMAIENFEDIDEDDDAWDSPEDYNNDESSSSKEQQQQQQQPSLGINIGTQLEPLTPKEAQQLKQEATQTINNAFQERIDEIEDLKKQVQNDFETSKETLRFASNLRAKVETEKLMSKIDNLSNDFLKENEELRMGTKLAASADRRMGMDGVGLEVGSWGKFNGMDVVLSSGLLGSVGSAVPSPSSDTATATATGSSEEENGNMENRILIICDEKQDTNIQKVFDKFTTLITNQFNKPVQIETYKPTSNLPIGGNNAQCLIISSTSLTNGQSSANNILSRVLRRTISPGGGKVSKPPSHIVIVSPLGTERIEKFPYSMQNLMGGNKLKKAREVEEVAISTVKGRLVTDSSSISSSSSKQATLDYTIVKLGEIVNDDKVGSNGRDNTLNIMAGDCGDGKVGIDSSANVLLQAVTLRPYARNATLSVVGSCCADGNYESISEEQWEDYFLRLYGPELWRSTSLYTLDDGGDNNSDDEMVEKKFEELANYIGEWSKTFDNGAKGTGLTTPVRVEKSRFLKDQDTSIMRRKFGVRLEFKPTATGSAYKSKGEEREMEQSSSSSSQSQQPVFSNFNQNREGGVEIRVEQIRMKDGKQELRVRARRCNMGDFTVVKELSEETIVKNLERAVGVWMKK